MIDLSKGDSPPGVMPLRAETKDERVLHLHLGSRLEPQLSLQEALASLGADGQTAYRQVNWMEYEHGSPRVRELLLELAREQRPTLLWMQLQTPGVVDPQTLMAVRDVAPDVRIVSWCGDIGRDPAWSHALAPYCDALLFSSLTQAKQHREAGFPNAGYLQIGYDLHTHHDRRENPSPRHKVVFQGQNYTHPWVHCPEAEPELRKEVVTSLHNTFGREGFAVYGQNWNGIESGVTDPLVSALRYRDAIAAVSISLTSDYERYSSDRLFRALACAPVVLVKRFADMAALGLEDSKNCFVFETAEECVRLSKAVLDAQGTSTGAWMREVAEAGAKLAREHHTWEVRMEEMAAYLEVIDEVRRG